MRAQAPVQGGGQDTGDGVVVLWCRYEHGVVGAYLLPKLLHGLGVPLVLDVMVEVRYPGGVEALATHPIRSHFVRKSLWSIVCTPSAFSIPTPFPVRLTFLMLPSNLRWLRL